MATMSVITLYLLFAMLAVLWFDMTRFLIPNWLSGSLILLYPIAVFLAPHPVAWQPALAAAVMVFAIGYGIFTMGWMGGGDIKLVAACTLWTGFEHLVDFIFIVAFTGGIASVLLWGGRKAIAHIPHKAELPRILRIGEPVPYGLAIAAGFLILLWLKDIPVVG